MSGTALLLPGQGSQYVGMGQDLADVYRSVRDLYKRADEELGFSLARLSWEGPEDQLRATENAQPAILVHSFAVWTLLRDAGIGVTVGAGHSLGELSAHLIAGTFSFETALQIVRRRGELMAASGAERPGGMAAVLGLDRQAIGQICDGITDGIVVPANLNGPGQIVISGDVAAIESASAAAQAAGARRVIQLQVSGAFHSPLMENMAKEFADILDVVPLSDPTFPVISNATVEVVSRLTEARRTLVAQLTSTVRWAEVVKRMSAFEPTTWLELGPGNTLAGLVRRIEGRLRPTSISDPAGVEAFLADSPVTHKMEGEADE